ncbi:MAG: DUF58 domain-containing protein [Deltaproteobacteria bacterium]|nr:MAG: DUF58 domain-containing protein [Deltaproteobacteria bacterium]
MTGTPRSLAEIVPADLYAFARRSAITLRTAVTGGTLGRHRSRQTGHGVDFFDHRAYAPGDDPRFLDWRAIGRRDRLVVRRTEAERSVTLVLLVDASGGMAYGEGVTKFDAVRALACTLAILAVRGGDRFVAFAGRDDAIHPLIPRPRGGMAAVADLAAALEALVPAGTCPWLDLLDRGAPTLGRGEQIVVALSDFLDPGAGADDPEEHERAVHRGFSRLARRHHVAIVRCLHDDETRFDFPGDERIRFVDLRGVRPERELDVARVRRTYLEALSAHLERVDATCRDGGIHLADARVPGSLLPCLRTLLARLAGLVDRPATGVDR